MKTGSHFLTAFFHCGVPPQLVRVDSLLCEKTILSEHGKVLNFTFHFDGVPLLIAYVDSFNLIKIVCLNAICVSKVTSNRLFITYF